MHSQDVSQRRTKQNIVDYVLCNDFDMFVTFSFAQDRYDIDKCKKDLMNWIKNAQQWHRDNGYKPFSYILVPEFHKDKKAIHFHGLFNNFLQHIKQSKNPKTGKPVVQKGKMVFNIPSYTLGFTNVTYIKNKEATARYVTKYITKDIMDIPNSKRYWASRDLKKPTRLYNQELSQIQLDELYRGDNFTISQSTDKLDLPTNLREE